MNMFFIYDLQVNLDDVTTGRSTVVQGDMTKKPQRNKESPTNTAIDNSPPVCNVSEENNSSEEGL